MTPEAVAKATPTMWDNMAADVRADYGKEYFDCIMTLLQQAASMGERDFMPVLQAITEALTQRFPRARYLVINALSFFMIAVTYLPKWIYNRPPDFASRLATKVGLSSPLPVPAALRYA